MSRYLVLKLLALVLSICSLDVARASGQSGTAPANSLANSDPAYLKLRDIKIGAETVQVKNFSLKRDAGTFVFSNGVFSFLEPVNGKITGAVFRGTEPSR